MNSSFIQEYISGDSQIDVDLTTSTAVIGSWGYTNNLSYSYFTGLINSSAGAGDKISFKVFLARGIWELNLLVLKSSNLGMITCALDTIDFATFDLYSASPQYNQTVSSSVSVATDRIYSLTMRLNGKNPSASAYYAVLNRVVFIRRG